MGVPESRWGFNKIEENIYRNNQAVTEQKRFLRGRRCLDGQVEAGGSEFRYHNRGKRFANKWQKITECTAPWVGDEAKKFLSTD